MIELQDTIYTQDNNKIDNNEEYHHNHHINGNRRFRDVQRRPSLLFDSYEDNVILPGIKQLSLQDRYNSNQSINKEQENAEEEKKLAEFINQKEIFASTHKKNLEHENINNSKPLKVQSDKSKLSIDDLDMISLKTSFDKQMLLGSPMYTFQPNPNTILPSSGNGSSDMSSSTPNESLINLSTSTVSSADNNAAFQMDDDPVFREMLKNKFKKNNSLDINPFEKIALLRNKYIINSLQDSEDNIKYDIDNWFMYPKPLPKFWKFEKDKRFQDLNLKKALFHKQQFDDDSNYDLAKIPSDNSSVDGYTNVVNDDSQWNLIKTTSGTLIDNIDKGFYLPSKYDDGNQFFESTSYGAKFQKHKLFGSKHYTGEYFDLDHYNDRLRYHNIALETNSKLKQKIKLKKSILQIPTFNDFKKDFRYIIEMIQSHDINSIAERRLTYLLDKFELFQHLNVKSEILQNKQVPYRDFYNTRKVDRNLLLSGCISQKQLNEFIWDKLNSEPNRIVFKNNFNEQFTLQEIFSIGCKENENPLSLGLKIIDDYFLEWYRDVYLLTLHLFSNTNFNISHLSKRFKPLHIRYLLLTHIFLEFDNFMEGEYLAELFIKNVIHILEKNKYHLAQISVDFQFYENKEMINELDDKKFINHENNWWTKFSHWVLRWNLVSYNIRWNVQLSRNYTKLFKKKLVNNFRDYLNLIFKPLFSEKNINDTKLQFFLSTVCSIDLLVEHSDDYIWKDFTSSDVKPKDWVANGDNPPIAYYMYYVYENLARLNLQRYSRFQNNIELRSGSSSLNNRTSQFGEDLYFSDHVEALACNILLCNGGMLKAHPVWNAPPSIQYLYYLLQIPLVASPLSSVSLKYNQPLRLEDNYLYSNMEDLNEVGVENENFEAIESSLTYSPKMKSRGYKDSATRDITSTEQSSYSKNPFMKMFQIGMQVGLSCKSVLDNSSYTQEPIMEEYSVAASIYLLNAADLCELSRTSVICSGFDGWYKRHWIGVSINSTRFLDQTVGTDHWYDVEQDTSVRHNVPKIRRTYRTDTFNQEWNFVKEAF
ncbi:hypothetical protein TBLA_0C02680 [Henningerozyma blattae CBS 6284]|uniref:Uncharacterized protein n=1 Tax=Henningerozyma blattae (strain ATCC 34711 / CBS 6284 / DSM 70876 / NBRC 10599 / NRRL Y-10934 / UCD 77-7) TaxID=1071380 RepID=I2H125_HENB6|nr:hypothetical protein TBLA_0C02680 [Tetrapisispora blattae CBS 6284]CCH60077.1 hypothetical protein TBLA_0C02680 [Tetrapisispora blattae CBS 6284]